MTTDRALTVLIGSFARGTAELCSDIDIVRVGHNHLISRAKLDLPVTPNAPISNIDYDLRTFESLYRSGSLFTHHVLTEGRLIEGDPLYWSELRENFSVTKDLSGEIQEQLSLCVWLSRSELFVHAVFPQLSHTFRALKNAAIFSLAHNGLYIYDKRRALRTAFDFLSNEDIKLLILCEQLI